MSRDDLTAAPGADADLVEMLQDFFGRYRSKREAMPGSLRFDSELWDQLDQLGMIRLTGAVAAGGSGASWFEAASLLGIAAGASVPLPLAEHDVLGGWLLNLAGLPEQDGPRSVCQPDGNGIAAGVPWARSVASIAVLWRSARGWRVRDVPVDRCRITPVDNLAGEPCDTVGFEVSDLQSGTLVDDVVAVEYGLRGALARCAQVVGGMERIVDVVRAHVNERKQFGRPIGAFQAVQGLVADLAAEAALARAATDAAVVRVVSAGWSDATSQFFVAVAKSCVGHASSVVVRNAHQALGAIGTTMEHELPSLTKPILVRRSDFGSVHEWDSIVTELALAAGRDGLWPLLTSPLTPPSA